MSNALRYFLQVAQCGSIRVAAEKLNVAPSAISRHIQNLEQELGLPVFERHARGVSLTEAGELYVRHARTVFLDRERVRLEIDDLKELRRGNIRISTIDGIVAGPLSNAMSSFRNLYPGITIRLQSTSTETVNKAVREGEADVGIAYQSTPVDGINIVLQLLDPLLLAVPPIHPLAGRGIVDLREALDYPLALPESTFGIRMLINAACRAERIALKPSLETNSIEALRGFALSGSGVTMLHGLSIRRELELGTLKGIPFRQPILQQAWIEISTQEGRQLPTIVERFTEHLKTNFSKLPAFQGRPDALRRAK
ncbi:MAG TPA: LysR family transcriptional regulator, partial [Nitrospira sp.]|nr:LysR family transcriptional regulator [Nitrospira sp.]